MRQKDIALRVNCRGLIKSETSPEPHMNAIAYSNQIVRIELGCTSTGKIPSEEVRAEHITIEIRCVICSLWRLR